jgi:(1->4)-alpha-D-glucan 1-alpha-D-glucosylmutase
MYRIYCDRIQAYMSKALQEAKVHTSWINPNQAYSGAIEKFIEAVLDRSRPNPFLEDLTTLIQSVILPAGLCNAVSQALIKMTAPGIPDFYQGTELWDFTLVDPDNRRPVDYQLRIRVLRELQEKSTQAGGDRRGLCRELAESYLDGRIKLYVIMTTLTFRRAERGLFRQGAYLAAESEGAKHDHVCAYVRWLEPRAAITVIPRLGTTLLADKRIPADVWDDTSILLPVELAARSYRNLFTGESFAVGTSGGHARLWMRDVLRDFPVALLESI